MRNKTCNRGKSRGGLVMPALVAGIHVFLQPRNRKDLDSRAESGHDVHCAAFAAVTKTSNNSFIKLSIAVVLSILFSAGGAEIASADLLGPGPWFGRVWPYGNDTGGIIPYDPRVSTTLYRQMAAEYCALWGRLSHVTSVHRRYGDYVGFVCMDRPGVIH